MISLLVLDHLLVPDRLLVPDLLLEMICLLVPDLLLEASFPLLSSPRHCIDAGNAMIL